MPACVECMYSFVVLESLSYSSLPLTFTKMNGVFLYAKCDNQPHHLLQHHLQFYFFLEFWVSGPLQQATCY